MSDLPVTDAFVLLNLPKRKPTSCWGHPKRANLPRPCAQRIARKVLPSAWTVRALNIEAMYLAFDAAFQARQAGRGR